jgi:hypothetical protein
MRAIPAVDAEQHTTHVPESSRAYFSSPATMP